MMKTDSNPENNQSQNSLELFNRQTKSQTIVDYIPIFLSKLPSDTLLSAFKDYSSNELIKS